MSRQDKATTERHTKMLREMVKQSENKLCADCKRNVPRWASWNIGVFICIRCSGIHRSMGTHISKVKSVDLDTWTPEQMQNIQKWGNHRANLYWEAHLKPGHVAPEHKMESFIRSKYESRRWALEGAPPSDPTILEGKDPASVPVVTLDHNMQPIPPPRQSTKATLAAPVLATPQVAPSTRLVHHELLSTTAVKRTQSTPLSPQTTTRSPSRTQQPPKQAQTKPQGNMIADLFTLDFHGVVPSQSPSSAAPPAPPKKDAKDDILSLYTSQSAAVQQVVPIVGTTGTGTGMSGTQALWNAYPTSSFATNNETNIWGNSQPQQSQQQSGRGGFMQSQGVRASAQAPLTDFGGFGGAGAFGTSASSGIWGPLSSATTMATAGGSDISKKDDPFGDIWK